MISGESAEFQHWAPSSPDGGTDEDCAVMTVGGDDAGNGFWDDVSCTSDGIRAICELDSSQTTQGMRHEKRRGEERETRKEELSKPYKYEISKGDIIFQL